MILICGALLGFIAAAFGVYAKHGLRETMTDTHFRFLTTAIRYNQVHAIVIATIGLALTNNGKRAQIPVLHWSGILFIIGTALFSFSFYLSVSLNIPILMNIAPIGGVTIMAAWLVLLVAGNFSKKKAVRYLFTLFYYVVMEFQQWQKKKQKIYSALNCNPAAKTQ